MTARLARWPSPGRPASNALAAASPERQVTTTRAPSAAKACAAAAPMPPEPPITTATLFARISDIDSSLDGRMREHGLAGLHDECVVEAEPFAVDVRRGRRAFALAEIADQR